MCEYCENSSYFKRLLSLKTAEQKYLFNHPVVYDYDYLVTIDRETYLSLYRADDCNCFDHAIDKIKINYCPMCGRKLTEEEE